MKKLISKWVKVLLSVAVSILLFTTTAQSALAYSLNGSYWDSPEYLYYYIPSETETENWMAFYDAASDWNATGTKVNFIYESSSQAIKFDDVNVSNVSWDGASFRNPTSGSLSSLECILNYYYTHYYSYYKRVSVAGHEQGHGVGLAHHNGGAYLMDYATSERYDTYGVYTPQSDDIAGVNAVYP